MNELQLHLLEIPKMKKVNVISEAVSLICRYRTLVGAERLLRIGLHFDEVHEKLIYPQYEIEIEDNVDLGEDQNGLPILGQYDAMKNKASIARIIGPNSGDPRRTYTLWHEVGGHGVLQGEWLRRCGHRYLTTTEYSLLGKTYSMLEKQANWFAAHAAAPTWLVRDIVVSRMNLRRPIRFTGPRNYYLSIFGHDVQRYFESPDQIARWIATRLKWLFGGLSVESLSYRLLAVGLIRDETRSRVVLRRVAS